MGLCWLCCVVVRAGLSVGRYSLLGWCGIGMQVVLGCGSCSAGEGFALAGSSMQ